MRLSYKVPPVTWVKWLTVFFILSLLFLFQQTLRFGVTQLVSPKLLNTAITLFLASFAGLAFVRLWGVFTQHLDVDGNQELRVGSRRNNHGILFLSLSMLCWSLGSMILLWFNVGFNVDAANITPLQYRTAYVTIPLSSLNSLFLLLSIPYFNHNQILFRLFARIRNFTRGIISIGEHNFSRFVLSLSIVIIVAAWVLLWLFRQQSLVDYAQWPDFLLGLITLLCLGLVLHTTFRERRLNSFIWLSWLAIGLALIAQILSLGYHDVSYFGNLLYVIYKVAMVNIYLSLTLSFVLEEKENDVKETGDKLEDTQLELAKKNRKLQNRIDEINLLKGEMGHRVKNILLSLDSILWLEEQRPEIQGSEAAMELSGNLRLRINALERLHHLISSDIAAHYRNETVRINPDQIGYAVPTALFLEELGETIRTSVHYNLSAFRIAFDLEALPTMKVAQAQRLAMILTEVVWNSYKRNYKNPERFIHIHLFMPYKNEMRISVTDGNTYRFDQGSGFGSFFIEETVRTHWNGSIAVRNKKNKGTELILIVPDPIHIFLLKL